MIELIEQAREQILLLPYIVQLWMRWLTIIFLLSVFFIRKHMVARWALAAYIVSIPVAFLVFYFVRDVGMMGVPHITFWLPLLFYIFKVEYGNAVFNPISFYGVWVLLLSTTIIISLVLDVKEIYGAVSC